jgi:hypothetical protein
MVALETALGAPNLCKSRGICDNFLRLVPLVPPCGGTRSAVLHIPAALPALAGRRLCEHLPVLSQHSVRTMEQEMQKEIQRLWRVELRTCAWDTLCLFL